MEPSNCSWLDVSFARETLATSSLDPQAVTSAISPSITTTTRLEGTTERLITGAHAMTRRATGVQGQFLEAELNLATGASIAP
jgi:hypothetical protein